jgi:hypothetical protein
MLLIIYDYGGAGGNVLQAAFRQYYQNRRIKWYKYATKTLKNGRYTERHLLITNTTLYFLICLVQQFLEQGDESSLPDWGLFGPLVKVDNFW